MFTVSLCRRSTISLPINSCPTENTYHAESTWWCDEPSEHIEYIQKHFDASELQRPVCSLAGKRLLRLIHPAIHRLVTYAAAEAPASVCFSKWKNKAFGVVIENLVVGQLNSIRTPKRHQKGVFRYIGDWHLLELVWHISIHHVCSQLTHALGHSCRIQHLCASSPNPPTLVNHSLAFILESKTKKNGTVDFIPTQRSSIHNNEHDMRTMHM